MTVWYSPVVDSSCLNLTFFTFLWRFVLCKQWLEHYAGISVQTAEQKGGGGGWQVQAKYSI